MIHKYANRKITYSHTYKQHTEIHKHSFTDSHKEQRPTIAHTESLAPPFPIDAKHTSTYFQAYSKTSGQASGELKHALQ